MHPNTEKKKTPIHDHFFAVDYSACDWDNVIAAMVGFFLQPFFLPVMVLLSKVMGRRVRFIRYFTGNYEEDMQTSYDKALDKMNKDK